jgi:hypothetical protein
MSTPPISFDPPSGEYRPGACNIGPAEIARRRRSGLVGLGAAAVLATALVILDAPAVTRWLVALPLAGGAVGLLQARFRFCAAFGLAGVSNFRALGEAERVRDATARRADRAKAVAILLAGGAVGLVGALLFVLLPL